MKNLLYTNFVSRFYSLLFLSFLISFSSCSSDDEDDTPTIVETTNVLVLNEGAFGGQNGTISSFAPETSMLQTKMYETANGAGIGGSINSGLMHENRLYAIVQSLDKVEIMDANTFQQVNNITDQMIIPREAIIAGNKLYVSNWGNYDPNFRSPDSYVLVIDLASNSVTKKIDLKNRAEYLFLSGNELFVAHGGDSKISVINTNTDEVTSEIAVSAGPRQMIPDGNGNIWVISSSQKLEKINISSKSITQTIDIATANESPNGGTLNINPTDDKLYFMAGEAWPSTVTNVYEVDLLVSSPSPTKLISKDNIYSLGIDPVDGTIYVGLAPDFSSNGVVVRFLPDGMELDNFTAGIAPRNFIFK